MKKCLNIATPPGTVGGRLCRSVIKMNNLLSATTVNATLGCAVCSAAGALLHLSCERPLQWQTCQSYTFIMGPVSLSIHRPRVSSIRAPTSPPAETARVVINLVMSDTCGCKTQFSSAKWPFGDAALVVPPMALSYYFSRHVFFFLTVEASWSGMEKVMMSPCSWSSVV